MIEVVIKDSDEFCIIIKPMLFCGRDFYPHGGWEDFKGYFDSVEMAEKHLIENENPVDGWAHLVRDGEFIAMWLGKNINDQEYRWVKIERGN